MKFAHMADCHIGSWKDEKLNNISTEAFLRAMDMSAAEHVNFILIAGDIFNTALPTIEKLKAVAKKLRQIKEKNIPVYIIPGSHDFSPSGKTILDVFEHAGLLTNVVKGSVIDNKLHLNWTTDKTGAKITGMFGKKGCLEKKYYETLERESLEAEEGFKIFMFHSSIEELKPELLDKMQATPISFLPKNCDYYAGGHIHIVKHTSLEAYKNIVYPGPLFPNNFSELEKLKQGGFYIYDNGKIAYTKVCVHPVISIRIHAEHESAAAVNIKIKNEIQKINSADAIVTLRIYGELSEGRITDLDFKNIEKMLREQGAWHVMRNTTQLKIKEFEEIKVMGETTEEIEKKIIEEHANQFKVEKYDQEKQKIITTALLEALNTEKLDGERVADFENRIQKETKVILGI